MKKFTCLLLVLLLTLTACVPGGEAAPSGETTLPQGVTQPGQPTEPSQTVPAMKETQSPLKPLPGTEDGLALDFENPGKVRMEYQGNRSYVRYITCVEELPAEEALAAYDEAFFAEHALLLVVDTVTSGSIRVELGSIVLVGDTALVRLTRELPGEVGTDDMATWLLWAEVEKGLDCSWELEGKAEQFPGSSKY